MSGKNTVNTQQSTPSGLSAEDSALYMKSLAIDGIEEVFLPPSATTAPAPPAAKKTQPPAAAGPQAPARESEGNSRRDMMLALKRQADTCTLCPELAGTRNSVVFGSGYIKADLVFVGEAPGREEDIQGLPFVGAAGQLLTKIIEAIGMTRKEVFICNVLKCRPPGNRSPKPQEIMNCQPYLKQQLQIMQPKIICALGNFAAQTLLSTQDSMSRLRQKIHDYEGIPVVCTYHPAYLLRNPADKRKVWEDMKMMKRELERLQQA